MKIIFFGTPDFAVESLKALLEVGEEIAAVVVQPDRAKGRGLKIGYPPVKEYALAKKLTILQPTDIRDIKFLDAMKELKPELGVVVAYGKILPEALLNIPKHGFVNVHASLLPKYRGASPIQYALLNGENKTGVTILRVTPQLDAGNMISQAETAIAPDDNADTLSKKLAEQGAKLLVKSVEMLKSKKLSSIPQDEKQVTYAPQLKKEQGLIDWKKSPVEVDNLVRAMTPWPGAFVRVNPSTSSGQGGHRVKIIKTKIEDGKLIILEVQPEGKKTMGYEEYVRGYGEII